MASTFPLQELEDDTPNGEWAGKVDQYVLGWEEQTFFWEKIRFECTARNYSAKGGAIGMALNVCL